MKTGSYDVAILGAGFSGLWTSIYLKEKNINHVVISANGSNKDFEAKFGVKGMNADFSISHFSTIILF